MSWKQIVLAALGLGAIITGALVPAVGAYLIPAGTGLLGWAAPAPGRRPEDTAKP